MSRFNLKILSSWERGEYFQYFLFYWIFHFNYGVQDPDICYLVSISISLPIASIMPILSLIWFFFFYWIWNIWLKDNFCIWIHFNVSLSLRLLYIIWMVIRIFSVRSFPDEKQKSHWSDWLLILQTLCHSVQWI